MVLRTTFEARAHLLATRPGAFFFTGHYREYPLVLVRLSQVSERALEPLLEDAWGEVAPKRLLAARVRCA